MRDAVFWWLVERYVVLDLALGVRLCCGAEEAGHTDKLRLSQLEPEVKNKSSDSGLRPNVLGP